MAIYGIIRYIYYDIWYFYGIIRYIYYDIWYFYGVIRYYRYEMKEEGLDIKNFYTVSIWQYMVLYGISMTLYSIFMVLYGIIGMK